MYRKTTSKRRFINQPRLAMHSISVLHHLLLAPLSISAYIFILFLKNYALPLLRLIDPLHHHIPLIASFKPTYILLALLLNPTAINEDHFRSSVGQLTSSLPLRSIACPWSRSSWRCMYCIFILHSPTRSLDTLLSGFPLHMCTALQSRIYFALYLRRAKELLDPLTLNPVFVILRFSPSPFHAPFLASGYALQMPCLTFSASSLPISFPR